MATLRRAFLLTTKGGGRRRNSSFSLIQELLHNTHPREEEEIIECQDEDKEDDDDDDDSDCWSKMLPEILENIIQRVELSEDRWPIRKSVVSCACVCKRWRDVTKGIVKSPLQTGKITFPSSLKQVNSISMPPDLIHLLNLISISFVYFIIKFYDEKCKLI